MTTLGDVVLEIRTVTDMRRTKFITDAELVRFANASFGDLDDMMIKANEDYKVSTSTSSISSTSSPTFTVPSDFLKMRGLEKQFGSRWLTVHRSEMAERNRFNFPYVWPFGFAHVFYRLEGTTVYILPDAASVGTYRIRYIPKFIPLTATYDMQSPPRIDSSDSLPSYMDAQSWCDFVVQDCAAKAYRMQNLDASAFMAQAGILRQRIIDSVPARDHGGVKKAVNTRLVGYHGPGYRYR